jgi:hypothetical protein
MRLFFFRGKTENFVRKKFEVFWPKIFHFLHT